MNICYRLEIVAEETVECLSIRGYPSIYPPPSPESGIYPPLCFKSRDDELSDMDN